MMGKDCQEELLANVDRILADKLIIPDEYWNSDKEEEQLLFLAQALVKTDYSIANQAGKDKLWSHIHKNGQLDDDDLDMVAGGVNGNIGCDENKKNGIS